MTNEIRKLRSPGSPKSTLEDAISMARKLLGKLGKAAVKREVAAGSLGYGGMNGAALTALATLNHYGLTEGEHGGALRLSTLAVKLIHPLNEKQMEESLREAALHPTIFAELYEGGYGSCDEETLCNHLIQKDFTQEGAKKAASVFKENLLFARLPSGGMIEDSNAPKMQSESAILTSPVTSTAHGAPSQVPPAPLHIATSQHITESKPSAREPLRFALDEENSVELHFFGPELGVDQIEALKDYLDVMKKRFERKSKSETEIGPPFQV